MQKILLKTIIVTILLLFTSIPLVSGETLDRNIENSTINYDSDNKTEYYAIIAACSKYNDSKLNLPKFLPPHKEWKLKAFYNTLIKADNWNEENIILLINEDATVENIRNAFNEMKNKIDENDVFLFSWQGHGSKVPYVSNGSDSEVDEGDGYQRIIAPYDVYRDEYGFLHNYLTDQELDSMFSNINSKGQFIIFECCYSGKIIKNLAKEKRVLIALTEDDNLGLIDLFIGFPMTMSLALGINPNLLTGQKDKNNNGFLSAQEIFCWSKPIINVATRLWFIESFFITFLVRLALYKNESSPVLRAFASTFFSNVLGYIISQIYIYSKSGNIAKNNPNMIDMFEGELDIIKV